MKLELKHLAPYLPYKLIFWIGDMTNKNVWLKNEELLGIINGEGFSDFEIVVEADQHMNNDIKPYLRPLSDLTKEVEHNGKKFVPIVELLKISLGYWDDGVFVLGEANISNYETRKDNKYNSGVFIVEYLSSLGQSHSFSYKDSCFTHLWENGIGGRTTCLYYRNQLMLHEKLFEWHFDVFNLIGKGLAIEKTF